MNLIKTLRQLVEQECAPEDDLVRLLPRILDLCEKQHEALKEHGSDCDHMAMMCSRYDALALYSTEIEP